MDDRRFDALVKSLGSGASRRSVVKGLLGLGGAAVVANVALEGDAGAARRPTPTPKPIKCPGRQRPVGGVCTCPDDAPYECGPDCCTGNADSPPSPTHTECCDNACCNGTCYGEELCCPTNPGVGNQPPTHRMCASASGEGCCRVDQLCCGVDGCCDTVCWGGNEDNDFCCAAGTFCPGAGADDGACCTNDKICYQNECVCDAGAYGAGDTCTRCDPGTYSDQAGAESCTRCGLGTYQPDSGSISCLDCPTGTYAPHVGLTQCEPCECGDACDPITGLCECDAGYRPDPRGCILCPPGTASSDGLACLPCEPNTYAPASGSLICLDCDCILGCNPGNGFCITRSVGEPCEEDEECASNICSCGAQIADCICRKAECLGEDTACFQDYDCCRGSCDGDDVYGFYCSDEA